MDDIDVTKEVEHGLEDTGSLPLKKCVCGQTFGADGWDHVLGNDREHPMTCNKCKRALYFVSTVKVYEVKP